MGFFASDQTPHLLHWTIDHHTFESILFRLRGTNLGTP